MLFALLAAAPASAGGWATVELDSTPAGVVPGKPWNVDITVLQHGQTPLEGVTPIVQIHSDGVTKEFAALATDTVGVYRARVVFPTAGRWTYDVLDGFMSVTPHTFPAVQISAPVAAAPVAASDEGGVAAGWLWGAGAALLLALAVVGLDRRRRSADVMPHAPEPVA